MPIFAFLITVLVGFFGTGIFGNWLNWPDAGAVFAIATMGAFILWALREKNRNDGSEDGRP